MNLVVGFGQHKHSPPCIVFLKYFASAFLNSRHSCLMIKLTSDAHLYLVCTYKSCLLLPWHGWFYTLISNVIHLKVNWFVHVTKDTGLLRHGQFCGKTFWHLKRLNLNVFTSQRLDLSLFLSSCSSKCPCFPFNLQWLVYPAEKEETKLEGDEKLKETLRFSVVYILVLTFLALSTHCT